MLCDWCGGCVWNKGEDVHVRVSVLQMWMV